MNKVDDFSTKPEWLQKLWAVAPKLARDAEKLYDELLATQSKSESRRINLIRKSNECAYEWRRAENAEAERDAWKRSSELYERESNHWYKKVLEQDVRLEAAERVAKHWHSIQETTRTPDDFADELEAALQIVKDDEK